MEKVIQIIDFVWVFYYTFKVAFKKIFFIGKKNPDIYIADDKGFFHNQSDLRYVPVNVIWDVFKISRIYYLITGDHFYSIYLRGAV
ncbi:hypothetical protein EBU95_03875 [bacterium]|nr:hypothetical protein [bacterium]